MFRIVTNYGMDIVFKQHNNGNWQIVAVKDGETFEVSRSVADISMPLILSALATARPPLECRIKELGRELKKIVKAKII